MAYFPNGSAAEYYMAKYCFQCKNWKLRKDDEVEGCPVIDVHLIGNYDQCENEEIQGLLERLWPSKENGDPDICSMYENNGECIDQMTF